MQKASRPKRQATNATGVVSFDGKEVPVFFRDQSESGARIRTVGTMKLPDTFHLRAPFAKVDHDCVVVWRRGMDLGVKFAL